MDSTKYYVKAHYRRYPSKASPHWIALCWDDGWYAYTGRYWTQDLAKARLYLKNELKKKFAHQLEAGVVILVRP